MSSLPQKEQISNRDKVALWYLLGSMVLGFILILALLLKNYFAQEPRLKLLLNFVRSKMSSLGEPFPRPLIIKRSRQ
jgi:hypothetical protein